MGLREGMGRTGDALKVIGKPVARKTLEVLTTPVVLPASATYEAAKKTLEWLLKPIKDEEERKKQTEAFWKTLEDNKLGFFKSIVKGLEGAYKTSEGMGDAFDAGLKDHREWRNVAMKDYYDKTLGSLFKVNVIAKDGEILDPLFNDVEFGKTRLSKGVMMSMRYPDEMSKLRLPFSELKPAQEGDPPSKGDLLLKQINGLGRNEDRVDLLNKFVLGWLQEQFAKVGVDFAKDLDDKTDAHFGLYSWIYYQVLMRFYNIYGLGIVPYEGMPAFQEKYSDPFTRHAPINPSTPNLMSRTHYEALAQIRKATAGQLDKKLGKGYVISFDADDVKQIKDYVPNPITKQVVEKTGLFKDLLDKESKAIPYNAPGFKIKVDLGPELGDAQKRAAIRARVGFNADGEYKPSGAEGETTPIRYFYEELLPKVWAANPELEKTFGAWDKRMQYPVGKDQKALKAALSKVANGAADNPELARQMLLEGAYLDKLSMEQKIMVNAFIEMIQRAFFKIIADKNPQTEKVFQDALKRQDDEHGSINKYFEKQDLEQKLEKHPLGFAYLLPGSKQKQVKTAYELSGKWDKAEKKLNESKLPPLNQMLLQNDKATESQPSNVAKSLNGAIDAVAAFVELLDPKQFPANYQEEIGNILGLTENGSAVKKGLLDRYGQAYNEFFLASVNAVKFPENAQITNGNKAISLNNWADVLDAWIQLHAVQNAATPLEGVKYSWLQFHPQKAVITQEMAADAEGWKMAILDFVVNNAKEESRDQYSFGSSSSLSLPQILLSKFPDYKKVAERKLEQIKATQPENFEQQFTKWQETIQTLNSKKQAGTDVSSDIAGLEEELNKYLRDNQSQSKAEQEQEDLKNQQKIAFLNQMLQVLEEARHKEIRDLSAKLSMRDRYHGASRIANVQELLNTLQKLKQGEKITDTPLPLKVVLDDKQTAELQVKLNEFERIQSEIQSGEVFSENNVVTTLNRLAAILVDALQISATAEVQALSSELKLILAILSNDMSSIALENQAREAVEKAISSFLAKLTQAKINAPQSTRVINSFAQELLKKLEQMASEPLEIDEHERVEFMGKELKKWLEIKDEEVSTTNPAKPPAAQGEGEDGLPKTRRETTEFFDADFFEEALASLESLVVEFNKSLPAPVAHEGGTIGNWQEYLSSIKDYFASTDLTDKQNEQFAYSMYALMEFMLNKLDASNEEKFRIFAKNLGVQYGKLAAQANEFIVDYLQNWPNIAKATDNTKVSSQHLVDYLTPADFEQLNSKKALVRFERNLLAYQQFAGRQEFKSKVAELLAFGNAVLATLNRSKQDTNTGTSNDRTQAEGKMVYQLSIWADLIGAELGKLDDADRQSMQELVNKLSNWPGKDQTPPPPAGENPPQGGDDEPGGSKPPANPPGAESPKPPPTKPSTIEGETKFETPKQTESRTEEAKQLALNLANYVRATNGSNYAAQAKVSSGLNGSGFLGFAKDADGKLVQVETQKANVSKFDRPSIKYNGADGKVTNYNYRVEFLTNHPENWLISLNTSQNRLSIDMDINASAQGGHGNQGRLNQVTFTLDIPPAQVEAIKKLFASGDPAALDFVKTLMSEVFGQEKFGSESKPLVGSNGLAAIDEPQKLMFVSYTDDANIMEAPIFIGGGEPPQSGVTPKKTEQTQESPYPEFDSAFTEEIKAKLGVDIGGIELGEISESKSTKNASLAEVMERLDELLQEENLTPKKLKRLNNAYGAIVSMTKHLANSAIINYKKVKDDADFTAKISKLTASLESISQKLVAKAPASSYASILKDNLARLRKWPSGYITSESFTGNEAPADLAKKIASRAKSIDSNAYMMSIKLNDRAPEAAEQLEINSNGRVDAAKKIKTTDSRYFTYGANPLDPTAAIFTKETTLTYESIYKTPEIASFLNSAENYLVELNTDAHGNVVLVISAPVHKARDPRQGQSTIAVQIDSVAKEALKVVLANPTQGPEFIKKLLVELFGGEIPGGNGIKMIDGTTEQTGAAAIKFPQRLMIYEDGKKMEATEKTNQPAKSEKSESKPKIDVKRLAEGFANVEGGTHQTFTEKEPFLKHLQEKYQIQLDAIEKNQQGLEQLNALAEVVHKLLSNTKLDKSPGTFIWWLATEIFVKRKSWGEDIKGGANSGATAAGLEDLFVNGSFDVANEHRKSAPIIEQMRKVNGYLPKREQESTDTVRKLTRELITNREVLTTRAKFTEMLSKLGFNTSQESSESTKEYVKRLYNLVKVANVLSSSTYIQDNSIGTAEWWLVTELSAIASERSADLVELAIDLTSNIDAELVVATHFLYEMPKRIQPGGDNLRKYRVQNLPHDTSAEILKQANRVAHLAQPHDPLDGAFNTPPRSQVQPNPRRQEARSYNASESELEVRKWNGRAKRMILDLSADKLSNQSYLTSLQVDDARGARLNPQPSLALRTILKKILEKVFGYSRSDGMVSKREMLVRDITFGEYQKDGGILGYLEILGVDVDNTADLKAEVEAKFRDLSKKYHPDRNKNEDAQAVYNKLSRAKEFLNNLLD